MDAGTANSVKVVLSSSLRRTLDRRAVEEPYDPEEFRRTSPFHARLVPDAIWRASKFERSFVTSIGQGVFEQVAVIVAKGVGHQATQGNREAGLIWTGQLNEIERILSELRGNKGRPNWDAELLRIAATTGMGQQLPLTVISDLFVWKLDGTKHFYSLKTVKPNLDQTEKAKSDMLKLKAIDAANQAYFALPYNPYLTRQAYGWKQPFKIFDMHHDSCILIGEEFWDGVGDAGTYTALLDVFEEVGKEFEPEIQEYLAGFEDRES
jgi:hypothetical protein